MSVVLATFIALAIGFGAAWIAHRVRSARFESVRRMFDRHGAVILLLQTDTGAILYANASACQFFGYSLAEFVRMKIQEINTLAPAEVQAEMIRARREERNYFVFRHRLRSGEVRTVQVHSSPMVLEGQTYLLSILDDITAGERLSRERDTRARVLELLATSAPLEAVLQELALAYEDLFPESICSVLLVDSAEKTLLHGAAPHLPSFFNRAVHGLSAGEAQGSCGTAVFRRQRVVVSNIQEDPLWAQFREIAKQADIAAAWSQPIFSSAQKIVGTFAVYSRKPRTPSKEELELMDRHVRLASVCIEQTQLHLRQRLSDHVFQNTGEGILITDEDARIVAVNPAFRQLTGFSESEVLGQNPRILASGKHPKSFYESMWSDLHRSGRWTGEIWNRRKNGEIFPELLSISAVRMEPQQTVHYVAVFADITHIKAAQARLDELAYRDSITGLANRSQFEMRLRQAIAAAETNGSSVWILLIDLDKFKDVNDALGHNVGNHLLRIVAGRFAEVLEPGDMIARMGGDEFAVLLGNADPARIAMRLLTTLGAPLEMPTGDQLDIGASVGISQFPHDGATAELLLQHADAALYDAKASGRRTFRFYTQALTARAKSRLTLETRLRRAIERDELQLYYQPQVNIRSGKVVGVEALARWIDPDGEVVPPDTFIPIAEETGLILPMGQNLLRKACIQARAWSDAGMPLSVAVNLSARQCSHARLSTDISDIVAETGVDPALLELEITETALMTQGQEAVTLLEQMKKIGVRMALDDFGTGYSSLAYLRRFPVDTLKIDRSFIFEIPSHRSGTEIASAIIRLAHSLNFTVLAEGVETPEQLAFLTEQGCDLFQGYYRSRPVPPEQISALL